MPAFKISLKFKEAGCFPRLPGSVENEIFFLPDQLQNVDQIESTQGRQAIMIVEIHRSGRVEKFHLFFSCIHLKIAFAKFLEIGFADRQWFFHIHNPRNSIPSLDSGDPATGSLDLFKPFVNHL